MNGLFIVEMIISYFFNLLYNNSMNIVLMILGYLKWHYGKAIRSVGSIWGIFLLFVADYFSLKLLFKNFFDPWKRMTDAYPKKINFKEYFYAFITNLIVRVVGIIMRTVLIIIGLTAYILTAILFPFVMIVWLLLPLIILGIIGSGIILIIK